MLKHYDRDIKALQSDGNKALYKFIFLCQGPWVGMTQDDPEPGNRWPGEGTFELHNIVQLRKVLYDLQPRQLKYSDVWIREAERRKSASVTTSLRAEVEKLKAMRPPPYNPESSHADQKLKTSKSIYPQLPLKEAGDPIPLEECSWLWGGVPQPDPDAPTPPTGEKSGSTLPLATDTPTINAEWGGDPEAGTSTRGLTRPDPRHPSDATPAKTRSHGSLGTPKAKVLGAVIASAVQMPMRQLPSGRGGTQMVYVPFTSTDLMNWSSTFPSFRQCPEEFIKKLKGIFTMYNCNYDDVEMILNQVLSEGEKETVYKKARETVQGRAAYPQEKPEMDWDVPETVQEWDKMRKRILEALEDMSKPVYDWGKVDACVQKHDEHPGEFFHRLCKVLKNHGGLDPTSPVAKTQVIGQYVKNLLPFARKYVCSQPAYENKTLEEVVGLAAHAWRNRKELDTRRSEKLLNLQLQGFQDGSRGRDASRRRGGFRGRGGRGGSSTQGWGPQGQNFQPRPGRAGPDECRRCRQKGHWAAQCPNYPLQPADPLMQAYQRVQERGGEKGSTD
ncbi:unnamed protein product [Lepidochelys kempii]